MDPFVSALEVAALIRDGSASPLEVVDLYLARVDRLNPQLNAITWRRDEAVRAEARAATERLRSVDWVRQPFFGLPIPIKDLSPVQGWPLTSGSRGSLDYIAEETSTTVQRLADAGFLLMGRSATPEIGTISVTESLAFGATRNPWDLSRSPGGSSGGAGAALAAGLAPAAHGSDGGGSIRVPAACCGLVGLKVSRGRLPMGPTYTDAMHGGAVEGVLTRTVADTAAILDCLSGVDAGAWYNAPLPTRPFQAEVGAPVGRLRIGVATALPNGLPTAADCVAGAAATAKLCAELGHEVFEASPTAWSDAAWMDAFLKVWNTGIAYRPMIDVTKLEPLNAYNRERAQQVDSLAYVGAVRELQRFTRRMIAAWGRDFDLLLTPTTGIVAPPIGAFFEGAEEAPVLPLARAGHMAGFTSAFNVTGQPAISLPLHWTAAGLPIGVQVVGSPWGEAELFRFAAQLEAARPWRHRRPSVG